MRADIFGPSVVFIVARLWPQAALTRQLKFWLNLLALNQPVLITGSRQQLLLIARELLVAGSRNARPASHAGNQLVFA
jgi:hypothetical protein